MARESYRMMQKFWLDVTKEDEYHLAAAASELRKQRLWVSTIRDALRLILDLRQGRLDVLFELFPWVRAEFMEYIQSLQPPKSSGELDLQRQLERLEQLLLQQGNTPIDKAAPVNLLTHNGPKPLKTKIVTAPAFDDNDDDNDVLVATKNKNAGSQSALNFIKSAFALNGMKFDEPQS